MIVFSQTSCHHSMTRMYMGEKKHLPKETSYVVESGDCTKKRGVLRSTEIKSIEKVLRDNDTTYVHSTLAEAGN